jgi:ER-bound oxygenase mpaB/B'/Rubber oxygenase, catalytic domain
MMCSTPSSPNSGALVADPLADDTISAIMGAWPENTDSLDTAAIARIGSVNRLMSTWGNNASLAHWQAPPDTDPHIAQTLQLYLRTGSTMPAWADRAKVERAQAIFMEEGPLSCTLLFCASLPECYVLPNLADVLHIAGQLEAHTEHRVRQTAAMIFPVMMSGGLMGDSGNGLAQILKVRLIHATIRHLILRGNPQNVTHSPPSANIAAPARGMHEALMRHGWEAKRQGLPCNQTELAYTLLTFGYVFLNGMRTMGQRLPQADETAYLHAWNVMGHILGIQTERMAHDMEGAEKMFAEMQAYARLAPPKPDVRPALGQALIQAMAKSIKLPIFRHLPVPMTQWLVGQQTAKEIGLAKQASWLTRSLFRVLRAFIKVIDSIGRLFSSRFSISRLITRVLGYHLLSQLLLDQTRPLNLPNEVLEDMHRTVAQWSEDPKSHEWLQRLEARMIPDSLWNKQ